MSLTGQSYPLENITDLNENTLRSLDGAGNESILGNETIGGNLSVVGSITGNSGTNKAVARGTVEVNITTGQLLALRATPVQLIAAPGAGSYIRVENIDLLYTFLTAAYGATNANLKLFLGTTANALALTADNDTLLTNTSSKDSLNVPLLQVTDVQANTRNQGIFLGNDGSAEFLTGAGSLKVIINYAIVTP